MSKSDAEKAKLGAETMVDFFGQFGSDAAAMALLEVLFEGLLHEENLFVSGKPKQTGNQNDRRHQGQ